MNERTVGPTVVVLPGRLWVLELTAELTRLGIDPLQAPISAAKVLQHICGRAGWPRETFVVAESTPPPSEVEA